ncbi:MAG TPA: site-specific integrase [Aurantimonas coralicida]|uniref:Site-specific integrase n=2 Tax=root TaxID=1 RepID=A0A9C9TIS0_9HYPH|nr:site-specific integrase [Aurantimonas coralicida]HEU02599.1 site-specific integrase [Aurantimonas coralicida]
MPLRVVSRPKSPLLYIRGTIAGVRVEESAGTSSRKLAEEYRAKREAEIYKEGLYGRGVSRTFAEAVVSYLETRGSAPRFMGKVLDHFDTTPLAKITLDAIDEGARKIYPKASAATRDRQFYTPTIAVLKHAAKRGWCAPIIVERPKKSKGAVVRWLTPEEAERLISACAPHLRPIVVFLLYTGARVGEALWLEWRSISLDRAHVSFDETKSDYPRGGWLHTRLVAELANLPHREGEVFRRPDGEPYQPLKGGDDTSAGTRIGTAFKSACKRAGITSFRVHDCRHTWATWHYQQNRDLTALMRLGGWRSEKMVLRYAHQNVGEFAASIERLPGGILGECSENKEKSA